MVKNMFLNLAKRPKNYSLKNGIAMMFRSIALVTISISICSQGSMAQDKDASISLSIVSLLANPEKYNGKRVRVVGYVKIEEEATAIYFHKEDRLHSIYKNGLALHLRKSDLENSKRINGNYSLIEGIFDVNTGHMGLFGGSIHSVQRVSPMLAMR